MSDYTDRADEVVAETIEGKLSLEEYVDKVLESPKFASQASKYILEAILYYGTRTVIEEGEKKERFRFFDDPEGDGEHAVLGNTDILNQFVEDLKRMASEEGENEKIVWFDGPTATGKSELKRCLISGLRGYSKTEEGKRYTLEWNIATATDTDGQMTYNNTPVGAEREWYKSPVNTHPLAVFPEEVREDIVSEMNTDTEFPVNVGTDLDPFSQEAYDYLEDHYESDDVDSLFSRITDEQHLRVVRQTVDAGEGIGILHAEDDGSPKERLVGDWMPSMLRELSSRGRKNPQAFSYDGVLSQGNGLLTLVEDASQHSDLLQKLLNVPEENYVKLDKKIGMDINTVMVILSNPDLGATLNQHADKIGADPLKALRRRLDKYEFRYLTSLSSEVELLHRELANDRTVWADVEHDDDLREEKIRERLDVYDCEFAPHAMEAAALYEVVSRLTEDGLPDGFDLVDKALLFDRGYHVEDNEKRRVEEFDLPNEMYDGEAGIPVTYTKDVLADLAQANEVVLPHEVLTNLANNLSDDPVFGEAETSEFTDRVVVVGEHIHKRQEEDVRAAILRDKSVEEDTVRDYVEGVHTWYESDTDSDSDADFDALKLKVFETEYLGLSDSDYTSNSVPKQKVKKFRQDKIMNPLTKHLYESRDEEFKVDDVELKEAPVLKSLLQSNDWNAVFNQFENLDPSQWRDPASDTETAEVKDATLENMVEMFGYSEESALRTSTRVMDGIDGGEQTTIDDDELWD